MNQQQKQQINHQENASNVNLLMPLLFLALFLFLFIKSVKSQVIYVNYAATGTNNGSSWANAYTSLHNAIATSSSGTQIWVAKGTYKPSAFPIGTTDGISSRNYAFSLKSNVSIYGGFDANTGTEGNFSVRNFTTNRTILSGDIGVVGDAGDNCYHVVLGDYINGTAILDGFTIRDGNANANLITTHTPSGHILPSHSGAGIFLNFASPNINNCIITNNDANFAGGGVVAQGRSDEVFTNCVFTNNRILTATFGGAGLYNYAHPSNPSFPTVNNCVFYNNISLGAGGAIYTQYSNMTITNTTIYNNTAQLWGGGIYNEDSSNMVIRNCIIWGNIGNAVTQPAGSDAGLTWNVIEPNVRFSLLQTYSTYSSNITGDPLFINSSNPVGADGRWISSDDGLRLSACSPAIDAGTSIGVTPLDIAALTRPQGAGVDMGAYETLPTGLAGTTRLYVNASAVGGIGNSWATAMNNLETALSAARASSCIREIWVAQGTYKPSHQYSVRTGNDTTVDARYQTFNIPSGVAVYGGFVGTETALASRPNPLITSVLSGDIGVMNDSLDNTYHVVIFKNAAPTTRLDGFTITKGNANSNIPFVVDNNAFGGGICQVVNNAYNTPTIANCSFNNNNAVNGGAIGSIVERNGICNINIDACTFKSNGNRTTTAYGGAIYSSTYLGSSCNAVITKSKFINNNALYGGAIFMIQDDSYIAESRCSQCIFDNNSADYGAGFMAIANNTSTINAAFSNCVFTRNNCIQSGGAVYFEARDNSFINPNYEYCTFYNNHNSFGLSGIINTRIATSNNNPVYINCIIRQTAITNVVAGSSTAATPTFINCNVEGSGGSIAWVASFGANGGGNIDTDPSFINASDFDGIDNIWATNDDGLSLQPASPCINAGNISLAAAMVDLVGNSRPIGSGVDMGAYEALLSTTYTITASAGVGGTISPIGITTLTTGSSRTYSISANAGYCINSVVVDGVNVGSISTYTFTGIAASHTIAVDFVARLTPTVSISIATNNVCFGSAAAIIASSINAGSTPLYNFYVDGIAQGAMAANIFNVSTLSVGLHRIYCVMTANNFCQTTNTVTSNTININVGNPTTLSPITGSTTLCTIGTTTRLYNSVIGGIWSSGNPSVATANSIGVVTAVSNGTASIRYTYTNSFGCSSSVSIDFNVASIGSIDPIMGATNVCVGSSILLSNATPAGVWSSIAGRAIINPSGLVTGISSGIATIRYTVSNAFGCSGYTVRNIVVSSVPSIPRINYAVGTINPQIGASGGFCNGRTFTLVGNPSGGVWSTSNPAVITINSSTGETNTIGLGSAGITYTVTISGCSNSRTITGNVVNCTSPKGVNLINENNQASNAEFTMFPNPTKRFTNLFVRNLNGEGQIIVADIRGKQVKTQVLSLGINKIDVSNLSSGFYLVSVISNGSIQTKKLIIE